MKDYDMQSSGTGTLITAKGDILTADHVVNPLVLLYEFAAPNISAYIDQHPGLVGQGRMSQDQVFQALLTNQLPSTPTIGKAQSIAFLSTDYTGPLSVSKLSDVPAQLQRQIQIEKESSVNQRDVAIVHASFNGFDTPNVQLGDSSSVQQQDELTIIGFESDFSKRPTDLLTPSVVNRVSVISLKTTDNGAPVIEVSGIAKLGYGGGPALDKHGNIVGIVSFGAGGSAFLQASNSAKELVQSLNLDTTPGIFQKNWAQAFGDYAASNPGH